MIILLQKKFVIWMRFLIFSVMIMHNDILWKKQHDLSMTEKDHEYCNEQKYLDEVEPVQSSDITFQKRYMKQDKFFIQTSDNSSCSHTLILF